MLAHHEFLICLPHYDYYTLLIKQRFYDYWNSIDHRIYSLITATMYELTYCECNDRLIIMENEIKKFKKVFSEVEQTMIEKEIINFKLKIEPHILITLEECDNLARCFINSQIENFLVNILPLFSTIEIYGNVTNFNTNTLKLDILYKINYFNSELTQQNLCKISIEKTNIFLKTHIFKIYDDLLTKSSNEKKLFNVINENTIKVLNEVTTFDYLENQIKNITDFTINCNENLKQIREKINSRIYNEFLNKIKLHTITKLKCDFTPSISADYNSVYKNTKEEKIFFSELTKQIDKCIYNVFFDKRDILIDIYTKHVKLQLSKYKYIPIDIMKSQSMLSFTILKFLVDEETMVILKNVLVDYNSICNNDFYQLKEHIESILKYLCKYTDLKYEFIIDNMFINNKKNSICSNIDICIIDSSKLFGKIFINKIVDKYIENKYKN
jgi:hypothetical protein